MCVQTSELEGVFVAVGPPCMNLEPDAWGATRRGPNASNSVRLVSSVVSVTSTQIWTLSPSCCSCSISLPFPPVPPYRPLPLSLTTCPPRLLYPLLDGRIRYLTAMSSAMSSAQLLPNACIFLLCVEVQPPPPFPCVAVYPLSLSPTVVLVRMCRAHHSQRR